MSAARPDEPATVAECQLAMQRVRGHLLLAAERGTADEDLAFDLREAADDVEDLPDRAPSRHLADDLRELIHLARAKADPEHHAPEPEAAIFEQASALLSEPDPGPTPFLVEDLLVDGAIGCVLGAPKVGKTWMVCELAVCIAAGTPALSHFDVPKPGPVMVVLEESGRAALHRRLDRLSRGHNLASDDLADLHFAANRRVRLDEDRWRNGLLAAAAKLRPLAVVFDPLVRIKGHADENSQKGSSRCLRGRSPPPRDARPWARRTGRASCARGGHGRAA